MYACCLLVDGIGKWEREWGLFSRGSLINKMLN